MKSHVCRVADDAKIGRLKATEGKKVNRRSGFHLRGDFPSVGDAIVGKICEPRLKEPLLTVNHRFHMSNFHSAHNQGPLTTPSLLDNPRQWYGIEIPRAGACRVANGLATRTWEQKTGARLRVDSSCWITITNAIASH